MAQGDLAGEGDAVEGGAATVEDEPRAAPGSTAPGPVTTGDRQACDDHIGPLDLLGSGLDAFLAEQGVADEPLRREGARAAAAFGEHLAGDLLARPSDAYAAGEEGLSLMLRAGHCLDQDAEAIARYAEDALAEATGELEAQARALGAPSRQAALAGLADVHPTAADYYARYDELWDACRAAAEQRDLLTWPDYPLRFVPRPACMRAAAARLYFLFYRAPAAFDDVAPVEYLVTPIEVDMAPAEQERLLRTTNDSVIKLKGEAGFLTPAALSELHTRVRMAARAISDVRSTPAGGVSPRPRASTSRPRPCPPRRRAARPRRTVCSPARP